jgi:hypothetical protein
MQRFTVKIERTKVETTVIGLDAESAEEAQKLAEKKAEDNDGPLDWELEDESFDTSDVVCEDSGEEEEEDEEDLDDEEDDAA